MMDNDAICMAREKLSGRNFDSILELLDHARVLDVNLTKDSKFVVFKEACDDYFAYPLDEKQMDLLIIELQEIRDRMV